jgi:hypothetical protein
MNIETRGVMVLSLALVIMTCVYAWVNRFQLYEYETTSTQNVFVRENVLTGDRCTINEGAIKHLSLYNMGIIEYESFPKYCKDSSEKLIHIQD